MISHLCNALVYQSGLFAGFYSDVNLGDAELSTEEGDALVLEEDTESILTRENGISSGTISGFYGYAKTLTLDPEWDVQFEYTGEVQYIASNGRRSIKDLDCGANQCPSRPATKVTLTYIGPDNFYHLGLDDFYKDTPVSFTLWALDGSSTSFKYYWILREEFNDYIPYMTELQYNSVYDSELGDFDGEYPRFTSLKGSVYTYQDQLVLDNYGATKVIGSFS